MNEQNSIKETYMAVEEVAAYLKLAKRGKHYRVWWNWCAAPSPSPDLLMPLPLMGGVFFV
jgi:hypothetical protein